MSGTRRALGSAVAVLLLVFGDVPKTYPAISDRAWSVRDVLIQPQYALIVAVTVVLALGTQFLALAWGQAMRERGVSLGTLGSLNHPQSFGALLKEGGAYPGRPWGEAINAWVAAVDGWTAPALDRALTLLLDADLALKETRISSDEQVIGTLVLSLCALPGRGEAARR